MGGNGFSSIQSLDELTKAGFTDEQARAVLRTFSQDSASRADLEHATAELKRDIKQLDAKIEGVRSELKRDIEGVKSELKRDIEGVRSELKKDIEGVRSELKKDIETTKAELKRDIAELGSNLTFRMVCVVGVAVGFLGTMMAVFRFLDQ